MKTAVAGAAAAVLIAGAAAVYFLYLAPGHVYIYVEDAPRFTSVYLTFSYVALHRVASTGSPWVVAFNGSRTLPLSSTPQLIAVADVPPGEYDEVYFAVSSATVQIGGVNITARIPGGFFRVHITGGMRISPSSTAKLLISFPHVSFADGEIIISPSVTARVVS